jgi:hypothetical protein
LGLRTGRSWAFSAWYRPYGSHPFLRVAHSLADSFAYAVAMVFLLFPRNRETRVQHVAAVAHQLPS